MSDALARRMSPLIIPVDFDGTIVHHRFPEIGDIVPGAIEVLKDLVAAGHFIILHTCRSGEQLEAARKFVEAQGVRLHAVNENLPADEWVGSTKVWGHIYIDDAALGCPTLPDGRGRRYVDWAEVRYMLGFIGVLPE